MTQIFKKSIIDDGFQWKNIPNSHVDMYFDEFKKFYTWAEDDACIKLIFIKHGRRRYSDMISKWKKKRSEVQPPSVSDEGWVQFNAYWDAEDTKKKAETMSQNRNSETGGPGSGQSKHVGGSLSTRGHAKLLKQKLGREPDYIELMHKTHFKKDGSGYCDARAEKIAVEVEARKATLLEQGESGESVNMNDIFIEVAGVKKQRIFGTGEVGSSYKTVISSTTSQSENEELRNKVAALTTELEEERNARATQAEDERAARDELERRLTSAMDDRVNIATAALMKQFEERLRQKST